jgi:hypothetical protein
MPAEGSSYYETVPLQPQVAEVPPLIDLNPLAAAGSLL